MTRPRGFPGPHAAAPLLALSLLSGCAGEKVWMRSGSGPSDARYDEMSCAEEAERGGIGFSINGGAEPPTDRFSQRYACLRARGYRLVPLTEEESARLKALGGVDRDDYWRSLLAKNGLGGGSPNAETQSPPQFAPRPPAPAQ